MRKNPFTLSFGKEPINAVSREKQVNEIIEGFESEGFQVAMISGVRGSGKTVFMTEVAGELKKGDSWIVSELSPERSLFETLLAELCVKKDVSRFLKDLKINLSAFGFGVELNSDSQNADVVVALDKALEHLTKKGVKVLITIDEVSSNRYIREFVSQFQIFMRKGYNVFLLMTGLFENIYELQNEKSLTFLYRTPKFVMEPLNSKLVAQKYKEIFATDDDRAEQMAKVVNGYPYAYQVLGYLCYKKEANYEDVIDEFDAYLSEYVYDKIWSELSEKDRVAAIAINKSDSGKVEDVRAHADMTSEEFSVYRKRLIQKGIICSPKYGYVAFTLPRFKEYLNAL